MYIPRERYFELQNYLCNSATYFCKFPFHFSFDDQNKLNNKKLCDFI